MKRVLMGFLVAGLVMAVAAAPAWSQGKKVQFSLHAGGVTFYGEDFDFSGLGFTLSPQVDFLISKHFMISPEFMLLTDSELSGVIGLPGVMLNYYSAKGFFIGGGAVLPVAFYEDGGVGELLPKLNLGFRGKHVNVTVYTITSFSEFFQYGLLGATLGYRF
jgi:hypothetical protein